MEKGSQTPFEVFGAIFIIMKEIKLTQGQIALVDDEDFETLNQYQWFAAKKGKTFYVTRNAIVDGKRKTVLMHWYVMGGKNIDHIDRNGCNNCKNNLRFCTPQENQMNSRKRLNTSSNFKGVSFYKPREKWVARIGINGKIINLGYYVSEIEAAEKYNEKAIIYYGEFANLNKF